MSASDDISRRGGPVWPLMRAFLADFARYAGRRGAFATVFVAFGAVLEGLSLAMIVPLLGIVTASGTPFGRIERMASAFFAQVHVETPFGKLAVLLALFAALMVLRAVVISIRDNAVAELTTGFVEAQRLNIVQALAAAPWDQVVRLRHARITHLLSGDIQRLGAATNFMLRTGVSVAMLAAQCVLVIVLSPLLGAVALALLLASILFFMPFIRRAHEVGQVVTHANLSLLDATAQFLGGLKLAMSQNLQSGFIAEFKQTLGGLTRRQLDFQREQSNSRLAFSTLSALAAGLLVLIGFGWFALAPATLITLLIVMARMSGPAVQIQQGAQQLANALPAYGTVKALERELAGMPRAPLGKAAVALPEGPVAFDNVTFQHADDDEGHARGLRGVSLTIAPGEFLGVSGPSGAGKTTFADLLVGLFPPQQGRITVGGVPLDNATLAGWRDRVAYISQDAFLFHDSVRRNLAWVSPGASEQAMWDALALAGAADLVRGMAHGLDTVMGERGTLISGGERQRIALARAVLRKPRLLVLDEATSAIDVTGEHAIIGRLRVLSPRPTIVLIAHRAESLALCDRRVRIEAGLCEAVQ